MPSSSFTPQLRPLSIGEVLDAGFRLLRHRFGALMLCVLVAGLPLSVLRTVIIASTDPNYYDVNALAEDPDTGVVVGQLVAALVMGLGATLAVAACFRVISAAYLGEPMKAGASLRAGLRRIPALFVAFLVLAIILLILFVLSVRIFVTAPLFAYLAIKWSVTSPAIVSERAGPFRAMRRSWQLTKGNWWRTFAVVLVLTLVTVVLYLALVFALYGALSSMDTISEIALATLDTLFIVIALALIYPLTAAILSVLYYDMRVRNEGFDLQLLARSIGGDTTRFEDSPERPEPWQPGATPSPVPQTSSSGGFAPPEGPAAAS